MLTYLFHHLIMAPYGNERRLTHRLPQGWYGGGAGQVSDFQTSGSSKCLSCKMERSVSARACK